MDDWLPSAEIAAHRPTYTPNEAERFVQEAYGVVSSAAPLPSDRDQNFCLTAVDGQRFVLKIVSPITSKERLSTELEVLSRLGGALGAVDVPALVLTSAGQPVFETNRSHLAYLVTWLEGTPFAKAKPHTREILTQIGQATSRIGTALAGMDVQSHLTGSPWNLLIAHEVVATHMGDVPDPDQRELLTYFLDHFQDTALSKIEALPRQIVHNDLNDYNLLVTVEDGGLRLSGILDIGDADRSARVVDPVIAATYAALHWEDPVGAAAAVVSAYHDESELSEDEVEVFLPLLTMRLAASVCISASRALEEPSNSYLTISQEPAWATLHRLRHQSLVLGHYRLRAACHFEPCPDTTKVQAWIKANRGSFASICRHDLQVDPVHTLDLGVSSPEPYVLAEEPVATREVFSAIETAGAAVGIGCYDEVRLAYDNALFEIETLDGRVQRTVHIGADVFLAIGAEIRTPLDGEVYGLSDSERDLSYGPNVVLRHEPDGCPAFYTLYGHLQRADLSTLYVGQSVRGGDVIAHIGEPAENGGWTPHLHFQLIVDMLGRHAEFPGVCTVQDRATWTSICPDPSPLIGRSVAAEPSEQTTPSRLLRDRTAVVSSSLSVAYEDPLVILRSRGSYLYDNAGRRYLDCVNNVNHVGHSHPKVFEAVMDQMRVLNTNTRYLHPTIVRYAQRLLATLPDPLSVCFFVNSGSEANDLALRLARTHTGSDAVVVIDAAYHGHLTSLIEISPYKFQGPGGAGAGKHVFVAPLPDTYRGPFSGQDAMDRYASAVHDRLVAADASAGGAAAFLSESLLSCGGQIELPRGYLQKAYAYARQMGALCIADEVQVGFGRVGTHFWGFQTQDVVPDIVTMGKPIGNGHPLGAVVTTPEIAKSFDTGMEYFNTYGGNPVSCAAGLAVLDTVERDGLQAHALEIGSYLKGRLLDLQEEVPLIGDVRGRGLFLGVELVTDRDLKVPAPRQAHYVINRARNLGVLLSTDGPEHNVLKIKPPLSFAREDADRLIDVLRRVLLEDPAQP